MKKSLSLAAWFGKITVGCALFALGFDLFLAPHSISAGGISGLSLVVIHLLGFGSVGVVSAVLNLPVFLMGGWKVGKKFFLGSLLGTLLSSLFLELFVLLPVPQTEPLLAALYGGVLAGVGLGLVFVTGASTGGSDIVVRLLKLKYRHLPIGTLSLAFDGAVAALMGLVFGDMNKALYTFVVIFITGKVIDAVVYSFDYSKVALIITPRYEQVVQAIDKKLDRGATYLYAQGTFSRQDTMVVLVAIQKQQISDLLQLMQDIDPEAFVILQEAHQVLGHGFLRYTKDSL